MSNQIGRFDRDYLREIFFSFLLLLVELGSKRTE